LGLLPVFAYAVVRIYSAVYAHAIVREFWRNQEATINRPGNLLQQNLGIPDFRLWSPKRIEAYQTSVTTNIPAPLGLLRIPSIEIEVSVLEGTDDLTLNRAVGHIDGTAAPGKEGNIGIAGHRDGFFRGLKDVHLGEYLDLYTERGNTRYIVDEIRIVPPEDVSVLAPRPRSFITPVTCYPFYFVGSAPLRYIVHASIISGHLGPGSIRKIEESETRQVLPSRPVDRSNVRSSRQCLVNARIGASATKQQQTFATRFSRSLSSRFLAATYR
jgi:sortase A